MVRKIDISKIKDIDRLSTENGVIFGGFQPLKLKKTSATFLEPFSIFRGQTSGTKLFLTTIGSL